MVFVLGFADSESDCFPVPLYLEESVIGVARKANSGHGFLVTTAFPIGDFTHYGNDLRGEMFPQKRLPLGATSNGRSTDPSREGERYEGD